MKSNRLWCVSGAGGWRRTPHVWLCKHTASPVWWRRKQLIHFYLARSCAASRSQALRLLSPCSRLRRSAHAQFQRWRRTADVSGAFLFFSKQAPCFSLFGFCFSRAAMLVAACEELLLLVTQHFQTEDLHVFVNLQPFSLKTIFFIEGRFVKIKLLLR